MRLTDQVMENPHAYRLWQAPFAEPKFAPVLAHNDLSRVRRVLDVGCGPGTNTHHFAGADYLGNRFQHEVHPVRATASSAEFSAGRRHALYGRSRRTFRLHLVEQLSSPYRYAGCPLPPGAPPHPFDGRRARTHPGPRAPRAPLPCPVPGPHSTGAGSLVPWRNGWSWSRAYSSRRFLNAIDLPHWEPRCGTKSTSKDGRRDERLDFDSR